MPNQNVRRHKGLAIYSRGFLGSPNGELKVYNKSLIYDANLADKMYRQQQELLNQNAFSPNVVNLYNELNRNSTSLNDQAFLRAVICTAKETFGLSNFIDWFILQYESPDTGSLHIDFLEDILEFTLIGQQYKPLYPTQIWLSVLNGIQVKGNETFPSSRTRDMLSFFVDDHGSGVEDFINAMLLKEGGLEQLVRVLYVLFGDTSAINHV